jgi:hypothetical protein
MFDHAKTVGAHEASSPVGAACQLAAPLLCASFGLTGQALRCRSDIGASLSVRARHRSDQGDYGGGSTGPMNEDGRFAPGGRPLGGRRESSPHSRSSPHASRRCVRGGGDTAHSTARSSKRGGAGRVRCASSPELARWFRSVCLTLRRSSS